MNKEEIINAIKKMNLTIEIPKVTVSAADYFEDYIGEFVDDILADDSLKPITLEELREMVMEEFHSDYFIEDLIDDNLIVKLN